MALTLPDRLLHRLSQIFRRGHVNMNPAITDETASVLRGLEIDYPYWLFLGTTRHGWWASSNELDVPAGGAATLSASTADDLRVLLNEQEQLRGRPR